MVHKIFSGLLLFFTISASAVITIDGGEFTHFLKDGNTLSFDVFNEGYVTKSNLDDFFSGSSLRYDRFGASDFIKRVTAINIIDYPDTLLVNKTGYLFTTNEGRCFLRLHLRHSTQRTNNINLPSPGNLALSSIAAPVTSASALSSMGDLLPTLLKPESSHEDEGVWLTVELSEETTGLNFQEKKESSPLNILLAECTERLFEIENNIFFQSSWFDGKDFFTVKAIDFAE